MYRGEWVPIETTHRRYSRARPQRAVAVRGVEDAQRPDLRGRTIWTGRRRRRGCRPTIVPIEERKAYSIRWDAGGDLATAFEAINRASDWTSFTDAIALRRPLDEHRLCRRRRQRRLCDVGQAAGPRQRRRDDAGSTAMRRRRGSESIEPGALPRVVQSAVGPDLFGEQRDRSHVQRLDHARLDGRLPRLAPARSAVEGPGRRSRRDGGAAERSSAVPPRTSCWPASTPRSRPARSRDGEASIGVAARSAREVGSRGRSRPVVSLYQAFEDALWRRDVHRRDGRAAVPEVLRVGRRREAGGAVCRSSTIAIRRGGTTSRRWRSGRSRDDIFMLAIRDADEKLDADFGGESQARLGPRPRGALQPSARQHRVSVPLVPEPRPGAGRGRRHAR